MTEHNEPKSLKVWDPVVRIGHWVIVAGVLTAYIAGDDSETLHVTAGYIVAGTVLFRILWGIIGSRHARFSDFIRGPGAIFSYLKSLFSGKSERHIGHNPAGGAMIIALLISLLGTTGAGMSLYALEHGKGPLAPALASFRDAPADMSETSSVPSTHEDEGEDEHEEGEHHEGGLIGLVAGLHKFFVYLTLSLAGLHVIGVFLSSRAHKENLALAMITGRKKSDD
ncbi:cytochrome b/b6 domain-containing protein [Ponticaulis sp.]|uniref:cytochrome b/b6 domain-containing protein n=1 Tax=Ponticaulis sp. TaxID=2020902 RepID=UPI000B733852|nr:cytochrome b/b6 domain-containing protein [Ponticaulis sp.]MAI89204.1 cytochrome B [Ponticaulis sp.]OUY01198.1 MAG: hypothetical protein CBB65_01805 [Hyphomonadaceae bacterium TMED5]|tara:strand:- start:63481 stop:64155 length:675 start_codon:yes stop_codon:yes gene_type:complete